MKPDGIEQLLPGVVRRTLGRGDPMTALLEVMADLHEPAEAVLGDLHRNFSPYQAPDAFLPFLARWVNLDRLFPPGYAAEVAMAPLSTGLGRLRELIAAAAELSQSRGTAAGLRRFLETATGLTGFEIDEAVPDGEGMPRAFHFRVRAPAAAAPHRPLIRRIIEQEKPAYVTCELEFLTGAPQDEP